MLQDIGREGLRKKDKALQKTSSMTFTSAAELPTRAYAFPYTTIRPSQQHMMDTVYAALEQGKCALLHAPTGMGKTVAALAPALTFLKEHEGKKIIFLTSRHTQHAIAIDTLREIKETHQIKCSVVDIIGKKWMCAQDGVEGLSSKDFADYCKKLREQNRCAFYTKTVEKNKLSVAAEATRAELKAIGPMHIEHFTDHVRSCELCPYELASSMSTDAQVIVADYNYIFNEQLNQRFFARTNIQLEDCIVIVDEAHNLPDRLRELQSETLSNLMLKRAAKDASTFALEEVQSIVAKLTSRLNELAAELYVGQERLVEKEELLEGLPDDYVERAVKLCEDAAELVRNQDKQTTLGGIANFLRLWQGADDGYARIIEKKSFGNEQFIRLIYTCLDPSLTSKRVLDKAHSVVFMSATLHPLPMYKDLLGCPEDAMHATYDSPFPKEHRMNLIVPKTTTKYSARSPAQFNEIAKIVADIVNRVPGNSAVFFPSYDLRNKVHQYFNDLCEKSVLLEAPNMSKHEKGEFIDAFKAQAGTGGVLLGTISGSFGEGVDLPGDLLKCVIVVGLPLGQPNLETKKLMEYYQERFEQGWDYGYLFPAFNRTIQAAGRCIRTETDKGIVIFLDERYAWDSYFRCFPEEWDMKLSQLYQDRIADFFSSHDKSE